MILRLGLGRWPRRSELAAFQTGFSTRTVHLPALTRALVRVPTMRSMLALALGATQDGGKHGISPVNGNFMTAWTGGNLAFMHLEKCGGIAVMVWLANQFHPDQIDPDPFRAVPPHMFHRAPAGVGLAARRYPLLWGHFGLPALERIDPGRFVFTFLREPRARLISSYYFWRSVHPHLVDDVETDPIVGSAHRNDLLGFLRDPEPLLRDHIDNFYARRLTGRYVTGAAYDPIAVDAAGSLAAALAALDRIGFVGITERLDESVVRLAEVIGATPPEDAIRDNVTAENHAVSGHFFRKIKRPAITLAEQVELDRLTLLDRVIYQQAMARFGAGIAPQRDPRPSSPDQSAFGAKPAASIPAMAHASSLSEISPEMPTAPMISPS